MSRNSPTKISRYKTTVAKIGSTISVKYHATVIVFATIDHITLDMGGYDTVTTRRKMSQAAREFNLPFQVYRRAGQTYARSVLTGEDVPFNADKPLTMARHVFANV